MSVTELQEQLGMSEEAGISIQEVTQHAKKRERPIFFKKIRQGEEEVCIASWARWNTGLVDLGKRCQNMTGRQNQDAEQSNSKIL